MKETKTVSPSKRGKIALAGITATMTLLSMGAPAAHAAIGGGAVGGGVGVGKAAQFFHIINEDDADAAHAGRPVQGWGQDSINFFKQKIDAELDAKVGGNHNPLNPFYGNLQQSCSAAIDQAVDRNPEAKTARVVQVSLAWDTIPGNFWATHGSTAEFYRTNYDTYVDGSIADGLKGYDPESLQEIKKVAYEQMDRVGTNIRLVCVALNDREPKEPNYELKVSTTAQATFPTAGGTEAVHDQIRTVAENSSIRENINGEVILNWDSPEGGAKSVSKKVALPNHGTTKSPEFTPADFGWETWPSGQFWYDLRVPKQSKMKDAVDTPDRVPAETWKVATPPPEKKLATTDGADLAADAQLASDQSYVAKIKAHSAGYGTFKIIDTITTDQVEVNAGDVYVENASGEKVASEVAIDRDSKPGNVIVSATLDTKDKSGWYTLNVPTKVLPTGENYDVPDTSAACYGSAFDTCLTGNPEETTKVTPKPDKVWALDETGALQLYDKEWTNTVGADTKTFAPGSDISAVVNGHIGRGLPYELASYEIVDDWSDAAKYIDLSDTSRTKVYFGQTNVTDEFEITSANGITEAKAKPAFLARTKGLVSDMEVKLVLSGQFRNDYDTDGKLVEMLNAGHETWNNEEKPTNKPPVFTETPKPDKVWEVTSEGALQAYDRQWTNRQGADEMTFVPGSDVSAVVNGKVPANLGQALKKYEIVDDWSDAAKYIDFTDASRAKVYFDGNNVTDQFNISVSNGVTTATAKDSFLARTKGLAKDTEVKLIITGNFRNDYDTDGNLQKMVNKGHETWNNKSHETNEPPVFTKTPKPDKVWALDENGALKLADPKRTNDKGADNKTFAPGSDISAVVNGQIPANQAANMKGYELADDWSDAAKYIDFSDASRAKVFFGSEDVTAQFNVRNEGTVTVATAKPEFLARTGGLKADTQTKLIISGVFKNDYDTDGQLEKMTNGGHETWNNKPRETNEPPVFTETPKPDKVWTLDQDGALKAYDPDRIDHVASDQAVFLPNELVSAVVNGKVPANLGQALKKYEIVDDWSDAAKYIDFTDASAARVYFDGQDVTDQFEVRNEGTTTIASAKDSFLARTKGLAKDTEVKLIINGRFRTDYETHGNKNKMINKGHETWNNKGHETNEPPVFTWTPDPKKEVLASASQGGDQSNIHQLGVWPGQIIEYKVDVDLNLPDGMARGNDSVQSLAVEDAYDPMFVPNKKSVEFYDARNNKVVPRSAYTLEFNDAEHKFTATFKESWVKKHVRAEDKGWLILRFDGKVKDDTTPGSVVKNQAFEILNGARASTNIPEVNIPKVEPHKEDLNTNNVDINGKTVIQGDVLRYRLTLDGGMPREKLAYDVHKFGMIDDFDEEYLDVARENIKVTTLDGADVTEKFNIEVRDGKFYVFAKHVDHTNNAGELIKGVQPENLAEYVNKAIDPINDPIIDQALLGKKYYVIADATVKKEKDGYVIKNTAWQNTENSLIQTEIVSNPLKDIDPVKDVVVSEETNNDSINGKEVKLNDLFNYRLTSSEIPANRAYEASQWSIRDTFDPKFDSYTGKWAVYADTDIYDGEKLVYKTGDLLADSRGKEADGLGKMFNVTWDEASHTINAEATADFLKLVNTRGDLSAKWSIYVKMERIAPSEKITNTHIETYNKIERNSNEVWTSTPENPAIDVEKFTYAEGEQKGDRDDVKDAYKLRKDTRVGFVVRNSGDVALTNVTLTDKTLKGTTGELSKVTCGPATEIGEVKAKADTNGGVSSEKVDGLNVGDLAVGQQVTCSADLVGVKAGETHSDEINGEGTSIFTGKKVTDADPWHAKAPKPLPKTGAAGGVAGLVAIGLAGVALASRRALGAIKKD